jgi:hypothetical protein
LLLLLLYSPRSDRTRTHSVLISAELRTATARPVLKGSFAVRSRHADKMAEWLRRWPAKSMGFARRGSNPRLVVAF